MNTDDDNGPVNQRLPRVFSDWNNLNAAGEVRLSRLRGHRDTDWAALDGRRVLLVDTPEVVEAVIVQHPGGIWWGHPDWSTQRDAVGDEDEQNSTSDGSGVW